MSNFANINGILGVHAVAGLLWFLYNVTVRKVYGDLISDKLPVLKLGTGFKCMLKHEKCEEGDMDGWSVMHIIVNFICGYWFPDEYAFIGILALATELFEARLGYRPRYILDPITNVSAYALGIWVRRWHLRNAREAYG